MMRFRLVFLSVSLAVVMLVSGLLLANRNPREGLFRALGNLAEVVHLVQNEYVDELNQEALALSLDAGIVESVDPWAAVVPGERLDSFRRLIQSPPPFGLVLSTRLSSAAVRHTISGSPAAAVGLGRWEVLELVDGVNTRGRPLWQIRLELLERETEERAVTLTVLDRHVDERREVVLEPAPWQPDVATSTYEGGVQVLKILTLARGASESVRELVPPLAPCIIDLRDLIWGHADEAIAVADLFANHGVLAEWRGRRTGELTLKATAGSAREAPLVVLLGRDTEGVGEILAAALRRTGAVLVGQSSFGHAPYMRLIHDGDLHMWIPVAYWLGAGGEPIDHEGVEPDVVVERAAENTDADPVLQRAIELAREQLEAAA